MQTLKDFDNNIYNKFNSLNENEMKLFCLTQVERQSNLLTLFDKAYKKRLIAFFNESLDNSYKNIIEGRKHENLTDLIRNLEKKIPDTDDYGKVEGSFAQNTLISLFYFYSFLVDLDLENLEICTEKVFENIDLVNFEIDENYNQEIVFQNEVKIANNIISLVLNKTVTVNLISDLRKFAGENQI